MFVFVVIWEMWHNFQVASYRSIKQSISRGVPQEVLNFRSFKEGLNLF